MLFKGLIMDSYVVLTSTTSCVVSPRGDHSGCALVIARRGETAHEGVDVNTTYPDYNMMPTISDLIYPYPAY